LEHNLAYVSPDDKLEDQYSHYVSPNGRGNNPNGWMITWLMTKLEGNRFS